MLDAMAAIEAEASGRTMTVGGALAFVGHATPPLFEGEIGCFFGGHQKGIIGEEKSDASPDMIVLWR
jgi:hypothetical protein